MSYNRITEPVNLDDLPKPVNNGERYPPIALPAPESGTETKAADNSNTAMMNVAPMLESGDLIMRNTPGLIITSPGMDDTTGLEPKNFGFTEESIRKGFIRKVYMILVMQLLFTCGVISIFLYHEPTKRFVYQNQQVLFAALIVNLVVLLSMACCETARRSYPINFICLGLFTFTMSLLLGAISSTMDANLVLMAVGVTAVLVIALSIFAIQTKYDFTAWRGVMIAVVVCLLLLALAGGFLRETFGETAVSIFGALIASFLLIYDTQLIIGGTHKYQFSPEEYIFAALTLYVDCVRIFLYVLRMARR
ncbi:protein lifeguard 1-like [Drosophila nasuta]|uniref:Protein lifeguard 1-like n=1 Tax=Drosophila albomicans TaxID=7291 RepID=A0A6P8XC23_DROAB|nr:protein lifeguard 1-like [Drosophila albomicans]XP_060654220.1 protein lifeguard 1-like [Drosophila nasuta]